MGAKSKIEWTDVSWTPIRARYFEIQNDGSGKERIGWHCERVSEGCRHCYAEQINRRLGTGRDFKPGELYREEHKGFRNGESKLFLDEKMLLQPLRWRDPRMVFVCSMTDLFADFVPDEWIDKVFAVMALAPQHTFQVLTKRAERMREYMAKRAVDWILEFPDAVISAGLRGLVPAGFRPAWPLPNVWLGVSAEDQVRAEERVPDLLATPAAVRFVSAEPLLGPIDFRKLMVGERVWVDAITGWHSSQGVPGPIGEALASTPPLPPQTGRLHQIITGGESGPKARPTHPHWTRDIRDQCGFLTAYFHKQNGAFEDSGPAWGSAAGDAHDLAGCIFVGLDGSVTARREDAPPGARAMRRVGKKAAGRLLDGVEHNGMPSRSATEGRGA